MGQAPDAFGLLDFTSLRTGVRFETYEPFIYLIFNFFQATVNRGY
jgi:hypothetical protein